MAERELNRLKLSYSNLILSVIVINNNQNNALRHSYLNLVGEIELKIHNIIENTV